MNQFNKFEEGIPSDQVELISKLKNNRIRNLVRYSWLPPKEAVEEWDILPSLIFRRTSGPLLVMLESGLVIGFASLPEKASVTLWLEEGENGVRGVRESISTDSELFPVNADDSVYSEKLISQLIGDQVVSVKLLKLKTKDILLEQVPREVGLELVFSQGVELVMSHGLHDNSDDFAIIFKDEILQEISVNLQEIAL